MTQAGGESATSGVREQMAWQLRAKRERTRHGFATITVTGDIWED